MQIPLLEGNSLRARGIELLRGGLQVAKCSRDHAEQPADTVVIQSETRPGAQRLGSTG